MRVWVAFLTVGALAGLAACSALTGLDSMTEEACAPDCGGPTPDASLVAQTDAGVVLTDAGASAPEGATRDAPSGNDPFGADPETGDDANAGEPRSDSGLDSAASDSGAREAGVIDGAADDAAAADTGPTGTMDASDAGEDAGCGPLDTVEQCGACGTACSSYGGTPSSCNAGDCSYSCSADYLDCNATIAPNPDGCECYVPLAPATVSCCGTSCPVPHSYDLQATAARYYSCEPVGAFDEALALAACNAAVGLLGTCRAATCYSPADALSTGVVCEQTASSCNCWAYVDTAEMPAQMGHFSKSASSRCLCPAAGTTGTWD